jgi:putative holliday junction resolvase
VKVLALDYGRARTGMAVSDATGILARPLGIIRAVRKARGMDELLARIAEESPERIVVGLPVTLRGERGAQAREALDFVRELEGRCTIPIETYDERFTTTMATRTLSGRSRGRTDGDDAVAAAHLLEGYLQRLAASAPSSSS